MITMEEAGITHGDDCRWVNLICTKDQCVVYKGGMRYSPRVVYAGVHFVWLYILMSAADAKEYFSDEFCIFHTAEEAQKFIDDNWKTFEENRKAYITLCAV